MNLATRAQIGAIHTMKAKLGLDDATYRAMLKNATGKESSKALTIAEAGRVIENMKSAGGGRRATGAVPGLTQPIAKKLRALWIAGWNLGIIQDRSDRAMLAFLERQTGVSHTRFLANSSDGSKAVEGLKAWLAREGEVRWSEKYHPRLARVNVVDAQGRKLRGLRGDGLSVNAAGAIASRLFGRNIEDPMHMESIAELDQLSAHIGELIRAEQKKAKAS